MIRVCVLVKSEEALQNAGVRIRYNRMVEPLARRGVELVVRPIDPLNASDLADCDIYLLSKIYDARSIMIARKVVAGGRHIGIDLFDNYFSQTSDPRFVRQREWLRDIAPALDFMLSSTARMGSVAREIVPDARIVQLNDPFDTFDAARLADRIDAKLARARSEKLLKIGWFGIGDNPDFDVGLKDLAAFGHKLTALSRDGYRAELDVLTNARALNRVGLELIRSLPLPVRVRLWSVDAEAALLDASIAAFIPANGQAFSTAKSLNRAVTAMTNGAQVLAAGYPLYADLYPFIYNSAATLRTSIDAGSLLIRRATLPRLAATLDAIADPDVEARRLADALSQILARPRAPVPEPARPLAVINGGHTLGQYHKLAVRLKIMSVGTPLSPGNLNFDVRFVVNAATGRLDAHLRARAFERLAPQKTHYLTRDDADPEVLILSFTLSPAMTQTLSVFSTVSIGLQHVGYDSLISACAAAMTYLFPTIELIVSERDRLLWGAGAPVAVTPWLPTVRVLQVNGGDDAANRALSAAIRENMSAYPVEHTTLRDSGTPGLLEGTGITALKPAIVAVAGCEGSACADIVRYATGNGVPIFYYRGDRDASVDTTAAAVLQTAHLVYAASDADAAWLAGHDVPTDKILAPVVDPDAPAGAQAFTRATLESAIGSLISRRMPPFTAGGKVSRAALAERA